MKSKPAIWTELNKSCSNKKFCLIICLLVTALQTSCICNQAAWAKVRSNGKNTVEPSKQNFDLGLKLYKEHDLDGAIDAFLQAVYFNRSTYYPQAYYWLGLCYQEKKLDIKAIESFKKSIEQAIGPAPEAHLHLAQLYLRNERLQEAEYEANKALMDYQGPGPEAHNVKGLIAEKRGELRMAQDEFVEALGEKPWRYTEAWMNYAENLMKQKEWGSAIIQLRNMLNSPKALKGLDPERIYLDIGACLLAKGDHQGALDNWHEVLNYNPDNAMAHLQLALLLDSERHTSSAIKEYKEYIRLSKDNAQVTKIKDRVLALEQNLRAIGSESPAQDKFLVAPSPYMRKEMEKDTHTEVQSLNRNKANVESKESGTKESGF